MAHHLADPSRLVAGTKQAFGDDFEAKYGPILPVPEDRIRAVQGGEHFSLGKRGLNVIHTPGHAPHHICLYQPESQWLFSGDALGVYFPEIDAIVPSVAPPGFDFELMLKTADELMQLSATVLLYSHYGVGREAAALIEQAEDVTKACGQVVLEAMKYENDAEQVWHRLEAYLKSIIPNLPKLSPTFLRLTAEGYMVYFKKRGMG